MTQKIVELKLEQVVYRDDLYPRLETSPATVQKYAEDLSVLPPIEVNQHNELIDGWHRWTAYKKCEADTIKAIVTETKSDEELLWRAIETNASFGLALSNKDKQAMARRLYNNVANSERDEMKAMLAKKLSVSTKTVARWLADSDKAFKTQRNDTILSMWLSCHTQQVIAEAVQCDQKTVENVLGKKDICPKFLKPTADHLVDFEVPLYSVWSFGKKSGDVSHFGNSEATIVDRLLYMYTDPLDIVVDPFAGSGSTIDVCKKRWRRYWVSDRKPIVEREHEIRLADIKDGIPGPARWGDVKLVYLDPPYWKQAEGKYSDDKEDLANMSIEDFTKALVSLVTGYAKKMKTGYIAMIIQPTQWNAPGKQHTDHVLDIASAVPLQLETRIQAPYQTQQCTPQMVEWAKEHKKVLMLGREIVVWSVG
ncbi:MAG: ParB N-terminal domain-containing protein [Chloroflexi bacterium]|nr:ParB N-terminal domain-containing protein [Chloroflexota bacterium]